VRVAWPSRPTRIPALSWPGRPGGNSEETQQPKENGRPKAPVSSKQ
jgi:hypothetical protein